MESLILEVNTWDHSRMAAIVDWLNDLEHMKHSRQRHASHSASSQQEYVQNLIGNGGSYLVFWDKKNLVGTASLITDTFLGICEIGILVSPLKKKLGYGKKIFSLSLEFCLAHYNPYKIRCGCSSQNLAMQRILLESGFELEAILKGEELQDNSRKDLYLYSKFP